MYNYSTCLAHSILLTMAVFSKALSQETFYKQYSVKDGLPGSTVYHSLQDKNGFIWFATSQGVSRFDGRTFKNYAKEDGLPDDEVIKLYLDRHNNIWFISLLGIPSVLYNDSIIRFDDCQGVTTIIEDLLSDSIVLVSEVKKTDNTIYGLYAAANRPGQWKFTGKFRTKSDGWPILRMSSPKKTNFYYAASDPKKSPPTVDRPLPPNHHIVIPIDNPFDPRLFTCLSPDKKGIFFHSLSHVYYADHGGTHPVLSLKDLNLTDEINFIYCENDSILWLCTRNEGVLRIENFTTPQRRIQRFFTKSFCTSILKDNENGYWVTTHSDGIYYLPNLSFYSISAYPDLTYSDVKCIAAVDKKTVFAGFADGNIMTISKTNENMHCQLFDDWGIRNRNKRILNMQSSTNHTIIIAGDGGIFKIFSDGKIQRITASQSFAIKDFFNQGDTTLIIASSRGITKFSKDKASEKMIFYERATCVAGSDDAVYWGTLHGLYALKNDSIRFLGELYPELSGVINHLDIAPDLSLWVSSPEGIIVLRKDSISCITKEQGILSNICKHVSFDGNIAWVSTNKGISRIDYHWVGRQLRYTICNITQEDGLAANDVNQTVPAGDYLWVATGRGISYFPKTYISRSALKPLINITKIAAGEESLPVADTIQLHHSRNKLRFELSGISYRSGRQIHYEYRMNSSNSHWSHLSNNVVEFSAIPFGRFIFEVRAVDRWGERSLTSKKIFIINDAPFWKSAAFATFTYFAIASLLAIVFYLFYRRQHIKKEQEYSLKKKMHDLEIKALQAQMNPHFIFNCLTSIQYHIMRADVRGANTYLHKFSTLMRQTLHHSTSSAILLQEELKILTLYLELEKLRLGEKMSYSLNVSEELKPDVLHIPSMIVQPYVENAIKHGISPLRDRTGFVIVNFRKAGDYIECFIEDNGPGIRVSQHHGMAHPGDHHISMGTSITANRINTLNVIRQKKILLEVTDKRESGLPGNGTIVHLSFPILTE